MNSYRTLIEPLWEMSSCVQKSALFCQLYLLNLNSSFNHILEHIATCKNKYKIRSWKLNLTNKEILRITHITPLGYKLSYRFIRSIHLKLMQSNLLKLLFGNTVLILWCRWNILRCVANILSSCHHLLQSCCFKWYN